MRAERYSRGGRREEEGGGAPGSDRLVFLAVIGGSPLSCSHISPFAPFCFIEFFVNESQAEPSRPIGELGPRPASGRRRGGHGGQSGAGLDKVSLRSLAPIHKSEERTERTSFMEEEGREREKKEGGGHRHGSQHTTFRHGRGAKYTT